MYTVIYLDSRDEKEKVTTSDEDDIVLAMKEVMNRPWVAAICAIKNSYADDLPKRRRK